MIAAASTAAAGATVAGSLAVALQRRPATVDEAPGSVEDALVQIWWREEVPAARISRCRNTGAEDTLYGGQIWMCRLWYLRPSDGASVCVSIDEHIVRRRIRTGQAGLPPSLRCE